MHALGRSNFDYPPRKGRERKKSWNKTTWMPGRKDFHVESAGRRRQAGRSVPARCSIKPTTIKQSVATIASKVKGNTKEKRCGAHHAVEPQAQVPWITLRVSDLMATVKQADGMFKAPATGTQCGVPFE